MRAIFFLLLVILPACKYKQAKLVESKVDSTSNTKKISTKQDTLDAHPLINTIYPAHILTETIFHADEFDEKSTSYKWKGLFKGKVGYYITDTRLKIKRDTDSVVDYQGEMTGWSVKSTNKDSSILFVSGLDYLTSRSIKEVCKVDLILPGQKTNFTYGKINYTLFASGQKKGKIGDEFYKNYRLYIKATVNEKATEQVLISAPGQVEELPTILFIGDIDGDGVPDLIIDAATQENTQIPTLYLSKPADKGSVLKVVGMHATTGC